MKRLIYNVLFWTLACAPAFGAEQTVMLDGRQMMEEIYSRHKQYPFVYEEQSMVMRDRNGKRDTRKVQRYSRVEKDGTAKFLLVMEYPEDIRGVAVLATRDADGVMNKSVYLPALGERVLQTGSDDSQDNFLGTDFTVENIIGERLSDYQYVRRQDRNINEMRYFIIDVYRAGDDVLTAKALRRHFVRQDNFFISQTEHYDGHGRLQKKQSYHDLSAVDGDMWRSGMILMENIREQHESLLKVTRRKFSHDYVPAEMFTPEWLYQNHPYVDPEEALDEMEIEGEERLPAGEAVDISQQQDAGMIEP